ncbi:MAG TPA: hypothetical protein GX017_07900 [Clostridiales bacterium]|jgi:hypothetical protein|nr:hypothetical protein [Clostridiales bacterium]
MVFLVAVSILLACAAVGLLFHLKSRKRAAFLVFQKKRLSHTKRRRHTLLDRDRGKVIPFPTAAASSRQGDGRPGSWETKK